MASKLFLGANVLLDLTLRRKEYASAKAILQIGRNGSVELYTSPALLHVTAYYSKKTLYCKRNKTAISFFTK